MREIKVSQARLRADPSFMLGFFSSVAFMVICSGIRIHMGFSGLLSRVGHFLTSRCACRWHVEYVIEYFRSENVWCS